MAMSTTLTYPCELHMQGSGPLADAKWAFVAEVLAPWPAAATRCQNRLKAALGDALQTSNESTLRCLFSCIRCVQE